MSNINTSNTSRLASHTHSLASTATSASTLNQQSTAGSSSSTSSQEQFQGLPQRARFDPVRESAAASAINRQRVGVPSASSFFDHIQASGEKASDIPPGDALEYQQLEYQH